MQNEPCHSPTIFITFKEKSGPEVRALCNLPPAPLWFTSLSSVYVAVHIQSATTTAHLLTAAFCLRPSYPLLGEPSCPHTHLGIPLSPFVGNYVRVAHYSCSINVCPIPTLPFPFKISTFKFFFYTRHGGTHL